METDEIPSRAKNAEGYKNANLDVFLADKTFEKELYEVNEELLKSVYKGIHKKTEIGNVSVFLEKLKSNKDKSELAYRLAVKLSEEIDSYKNFNVPDYIKKALTWVIEGT